LNAPAGNALLKILEEPPNQAFFIAVSDALDAVLPTVRSRCVLVRAPMPDRREALVWLEAHGIEDAEARLAEAGGAPVGLEREDDEPRRLSADVRAGVVDLVGRGRPPNRAR